MTRYNNPMNNNYLKEQIDQIDKRIEDIKPLLEDPELAGLAAEEIKELESQKEQLQSSVIRHQTSDSLTTDSEAILKTDVCILEIRSAAGGDEAGLFAGGLLRMYSRFAPNNG